MLRRKKHLRIAALFCLLTFVQSLILPGVAQALTAGPTAPETADFEPIDTTDMVNLNTGDFTYNLPLLQVPGPEGGYPVNLSYHAGIRPLQEASWVGLGWSLNPGAINRVVNGYPDDHKGITRTVTDFWPGGETVTYSIGIGFGLPNSPLEMGLNLAITNDTYRGVGGDIGFSLEAAKWKVQANGAGLKAGANLGVGPFKYSLTTDFEGNLSHGTALGMSLAGTGLGRGLASLGLSTSVGASIDFTGGSTSFSVGGFTLPIANNRIQLSEDQWGVRIPIPIGKVMINLGYHYYRYWIHETDQAETYGTLYAVDSKPTALSANRSILDDDISFDSYILPEIGKNIVDHPDPNWLQGGAYPAYDAYQVLGQGVGGNMQPYLFENGSLYRKKLKDTYNNRTDLAFRLPQEFLHHPYFKGKGEFSNFLTHNSDPQLNLSYDAPTADPQDFSTPTGGFDAASFQLAGAQHVETFTNDEISNAPVATRNRGLINYPGMSNTQRTEGDKGDQIGAYRITNPSGVTYHYALPVYAYDETIKSTRPTTTNGTFLNTQSNPAPYAYTWLLTAITGPDFVDRNDGGNPDGLANEGDYGYWVTFDYGQWVGDYEWRTPFTGQHIDIDKRVYQYSYGKKEIYYLDAIKTRSHTALFIKDLRYDGKSVTDGNLGGSDIRNGTLCSPPPLPGVNGPIRLPRSLLRLDRIYLLNNDDLSGSYALADLRDNGNLEDKVTFNLNGCVNTITYHQSDELLDVSDLNSTQNQTLLNKAIRVIDLDNNHYELCPETDNSYTNSNLYDANPDLSDKQGKLTLKGVAFKGVGGQSVLPPTNFSYELEQPLTSTFNVISASPNTGGLSGTIEINANGSSFLHQVVKYQTGGQDYYLYIDKYLGDDEYAYNNLGDHLPTNAHSGTLAATKNPPFDLKYYDAYGFYKPDFIYNNELSGPTDIQRIATPKGARMSDAWSLREIETALGAKVKVTYSPRTYQSLVMQDKYRLNIRDIEKITTVGGETRFKISFHENVLLDEFFDNGDQIDITFPYAQNVYSETVQVLDIRDDQIPYRFIETSYPYPATSPNTGGDRGFVDFDCSECVGNGIKVDEIEVTDGVRSRTTRYEYYEGVNSYVPTFAHNASPVVDVDVHKEYNRKFHEDLMEIYALAREIPSPGVMYGRVEISEAENGTAIPGYKRYRFRTFSDDMVTIDYGPVEQYDFTGEGSGIGQIQEVSKRKVTIKNKTSHMGSVLTYELIDGQENLAYQVVNDYADDEVGESESDYAAYNNQGLIHQGFNELRIKYDYPTSTDQHLYLKGVESIHRNYPNVLKNTTITSEGLSTVTHNRKYDLFSGALTEAETESGYGHYLLTQTVPAYEKYPEMGLRLNGTNHKHMLTQPTAVLTYRSNGTGFPLGNPLAASVTTWEDDWTYRERDASNRYVDGSVPDPNKVWRQHENYVYQDLTNPDGTYATWVPFDWSTGASNGLPWKKVSEVSRYDHYSNALEEYYEDETYAAVKLGYDEALPLITATPAKYVEFAYSGAEDHDASGNWFGGEVKAPNSAALVSAPVHTGEQSIRLNAGERYGFTYQIGVAAYNQAPAPDELRRDKKYEARLWVHESNIDLAHNYLYCSYQAADGTVLDWQGVSPNAATTVKVGEWYQLRLPIEIESGSTLLACRQIGVGTFVGVSAGDTYLDDFRFAPVDAAVSAYVYDPQTDLVTFMLDQENYYTQYVYDAAGRLQKVYRETDENPTGKRLVSESEYHYQRPF